MIQSPFRFEKSLTPEDFQKIGQLSLRWAHIDHVIGNCLRVLLGLSDEEAVIKVFPLGASARLDRIQELRKLKPLGSPEAEHAWNELKPVMRGLLTVRTNVAHVVLIPDSGGQLTFHLRNKERDFTKEEIFETEELTNYAAHAALVLRHALGDKDPEGAPGALPDRPPIPAFLQPFISWPTAQSKEGR